MGYYSDVGIKCEEKAFKMFSQAWELNNFTPGHVYRMVCGERYIYTIVWYCVKWYSSCDTINAIESVMDDLDEMDFENIPGLAYHFIRIGEEIVDNEERSNSWDLDFYLMRSFPTDGSEIDISHINPPPQVPLSDYLEGE